ncbi:hypothetical protein F4780DRAFT_771789 [Xylariomycetidae sp. FL0641]|nr:hypothetical protein F4780DRAFT_771789 [Xylariomycetidae sp. FL0641]
MYQRRPSNTSISSTGSSVATKDSFDAILSSPTSSRRTSFDSWGSSASRRSEYGFQRPAPIKQKSQYRRKREPNEMMAALPEEVLGLILANLRELHLEPGSTSCATCMMRDLCSVSLSARKFLRVAQVALYEDIQLVGADLHSQKKRLKLGFGSRLTLLRRTLRANPDLGAMVRTLKPPAAPQGVPLDLYQNLVASVIMACPNFERLLGFHSNYDFSFSRLFHALSTRTQLKQIHWTLEASRFQRKRRMSNAAPLLNAANPNYQEAPGDLLPEQSDDFLDMHANWTELETLSIHCLPGATLTPVTVLPDLMSHMPALKTLHLSHLPFTAFNDANLLSLPPLETLTLSHLPGVSSEGLSSLARRPSSRALRRLTLHHVDVDSLPTLSQLLSFLPNLRDFALTQTIAPAMPANERIWLFPYLASKTLTRLHWDVVPAAAHAMPTPPTTGSGRGGSAGACDADRILARSIACAGFPRLRALRAPHDPDALFQNLCVPRTRIERPGDRLVVAAAVPALPGHGSSPPMTPTTPTTPKLQRSPGTATAGLLAFPVDDLLFPSKVGSHLAAARAAAQARLEAARQRGAPRFRAEVWDERGARVASEGLAPFLGAVGTDCRLAYVLEADADALDANGGLRDVADVLGDGGENLARPGAPEGCNGRWNSYASAAAAAQAQGGGAAKSREAERWWHTERGRWRAVEL